ncbi:MAG: DUF6159 family protein [Phycisphaerales bacterium]
MFAKLSRSWELTKASSAVLRDDKRLVLLPLVSGTLSFIIGASFIVPLVLLTVAQETAKGAGHEAKFEFGVIHGVVLFALYFMSYSIVAYFNAALICCAMDKFDGKPVSLRSGLARAGKRLPQILGWSAINATVGVILQWIKEETGLLGRIVAGFVGLAWTIATFFVIPVLVVEGIGPIAAIKRSTSVMKKMWGETLIVNVGVSGAMGLIGFLGFLFFAAAGVGISLALQSAWPGIIAAIVLIAFLTLLALVGSTLKGILVAACYRMAFNGETPAGFDGQTLRAMFAEKKK